MHDTHFAVQVVILLLVISSVVAMSTKWIRLPYTLALVIVGLAISPFHFLPVVHISPELILLIFLPALLFEAAWNLKLDHLRHNAWPIFLLALPGVLISVAVSALVLIHGAGVEWQNALLFASIIAATDPVSVLALFRQLGLPSRLTTVVEGESLFNDGTAVVVFGIILSLVTGGEVPPAGEIAIRSLRQFGVVVFGGLAIGAVLGLIASKLTSFFDDHLLEITLTTVTAYGAFLLAESLHVSPVIAVLVAGLFLGNLGRATGMSPTTQVAVNSFWEYAAFVVNSLVFLLIGLETQVGTFATHWPQVLWAVAAMLAGRMAAVYLMLPLVNRLTEPVPFRWAHVFFWGGLRGSLSLALALSLPVALASRHQLVVMVFGAVLFSLLVQGLTISPLLRLLGFKKMAALYPDYERLRATLQIHAASAAELDRMHREGALSAAAYELLRAEQQKAQEDAQREIVDEGRKHPALAEAELRLARRHLLATQKAKLSELYRDGTVSRETEERLSGKLDQRISSENAH
jgi:CPA1 family monovalent cation:H+ antiporter